MPKFRVKHYPEGYSVEIQKSKWYGKKYWIHVISMIGDNETPCYYETFNGAVESAANSFKWDLYRNY